MLTRRSLVRMTLASLTAAGTMRSAAAQGPDAEWRKTIDAARKEGKVVVYNGAVGTPALPKVLAAFEAKYGLRTELLEARASELRERIRTEQAAGKVLGDVSHNGSTTTALQLAEGTFVPYGVLPGAGRPVAPFKADGTRVPIYVIQYGILINTDLVKPGEEPRSWKDLVHPRFDGAVFKSAPRPNAAQLLYGNLGFVMTVGGLEGKVTAEARAIAQARLLGTTDRTLQDEMLKLARTIYK
jgi:iron(III) transport system substrate-binding protein